MASHPGATPCLISSLPRKPRPWTHPPSTPRPTCSSPTSNRARTSAGRPGRRSHRRNADQLPGRTGSSPPPALSTPNSASSRRARRPTSSCWNAPCRTTPRSARCFAAKRYRSPEHRSFHRSAVYTEGRSTRNTRDTRALANKSTHGRAVAAAQWSFAEFQALSRMWQLGAPVPYPVQVNGTEVLMEFLGDADGTAAPRLAQVRGARTELADLYAQVVEIMRTFAAAGFAHGDLSAYNLLVHEERVRVIDLPQIVDIIANPQGLDLLHRDCVNICDWFARRRLECDPEALFAELLAA
ncbi:MULTISPECIES: RIO1 family regulatory kinase/ATPase [unclassified Microbacterium]|uniref:RIO1 family regulatory kinase/ATPase domain-containing protein n=1 Tax=unclassified Microbacterium TaxID=2609290 RepID=UPI00217D8D7C|nr:MULTISPECIES: RIO1 family regulatory kinase/ATPase [unclassified Microbacterium]